MNIDANTILRAVLDTATDPRTDSDPYHRGLLKGQIIAAKCIGPVDGDLLERATAATDGLRTRKMDGRADFDKCERDIEFHGYEGVG
jgi:hypothetical protein